MIPFSAIDIVISFIISVSMSFLLLLFDFNKYIIFILIYTIKYNKIKMAIQRVGWRPYVTTSVVNAVDADAQAFIAAAGITDLTQASAISTLVNDLKTYGLWTKMKAIYPFVGGTATSHKFNLKDPRDLDAAFRLVFNGGWTHTSNGALPNGTTGYADTKFINAQVYPSSITNIHVSYYSRTNTNKYEMIGMQDDNVGQGSQVYLQDNGAIQYYSALNTDANSITVNKVQSSIGHYLTSRTSLTLLKGYRDGVVQGSNTNTSSGLKSTLPIIIGGAVFKYNSTSYYYGNKEAAFASIGDGLTDTEAANFYTAVQKFNTSLGRQVGTPYVSDADAVSFLTAAGITDGTQAVAINALVIDMKAAGVWSKMKAIYPFVGGNANSHKFNLKDPRDLDAAYRLVFSVTGWTHGPNGAFSNGTSGYADPKMLANQIFTSTNGLMGVYTSSTSLSGAGTYIYSVSNMGSSEWSMNYGSGNLNFGMYGTNNLPSAATLQGLSAVGMETNGYRSIYKNGSRLVSSNNGFTSMPQNLNMFISARNANGTADYFTSLVYSFSFISSTLTLTEYSEFYTAVQKYQTTLGRQVNVPLVSDSDAQSFLNAAGITSYTQANAVNTLVVDLKAANIWTKMKALYPFVGGNAASHKWNLKDPRDVDAAFRLAFVGGWTHTSTGAKPNGTNGYANTYLVPSARYTDSNSISIGFYSRTNISENSNDIGSMQSVLKSIGIQTRWTDNKIYGVCYDDSVRAIIVNNLDSTGFFTLSRTTSTSLRLYKNETTLGSYTNTVTGSLPTDQINLGSYNGLTNFSTREQALAFIGDGLSETEAANFYTAVQKFNTSLGRQVGTPVYNTNGLVLNLDAGNANSYSGTGSTWIDLASSNNGTLLNGPTYDSTNGGSILFDGVNDRVSTFATKFLDANSKTIDVWFKSTSSVRQGLCGTRPANGVVAGWVFTINRTTTGNLTYFHTGSGVAEFSAGIATNIWYNAVVTHDYTTGLAKVYLNGNLIGSASVSTINSSSYNGVIGDEDETTPSSPFKGNIPKVAMYNRALSATEVLQNFNNTRGRFGL